MTSLYVGNSKKVKNLSHLFYSSYFSRMVVGRCFNKNLKQVSTGEPGACQPPGLGGELIKAAVNKNLL